MESENVAEFRPLGEHERKLLEKLLNHHAFEGRDELRKQLDSTTARLMKYQDNYGSIELRVAQPIPAKVKNRVPVEAEYPDQDGIPGWVLLHVNREGVMCELEICRADGKPLIWLAAAERIEPFSPNYGALIEPTKAEREK